MKKWLVVYSTEEFSRLQIVIWGDKENVRSVLKKHLGNRPFTINKITEVSVND